MTFDTNGNTLTLSGPLSGSNEVVKAGAGTLVLSGTNSTTGAGLQINQGTVSVSAAANLSAGNVRFQAGTPTLRATGTFASAGSMTFVVNSTVEVTGGNALTWSGQLSPWNGGETLTKTGTGALVLARASGNTYSGTTTVSGGVLRVTNTSGTGTGTAGVTVQAAGSLGGNGSVGGLVTAAGAVAPSDAAGTGRGNLTLAGGADLSGGGTMTWKLGALSTANPGTDFDRLTVGGTLTLGGTSKLTLDFAALGADGPNGSNAFWQTPRTWTVVDFTGAGPQVSNFSQITNPTYPSGTFSLLDPAFNGNDIVLQFTPVPEPAAVLGMAVAGLGLARWVRRRWPV